MNPNHKLEFNLGESYDNLAFCRLIHAFQEAGTEYKLTALGLSVCVTILG